MFLTRTFTKLSTKSSFSTSLKTNSFLKFLKSEILSEPKEVQQPLLRGWTIKDIKGEKEFSLKKQYKSQGINEEITAIFSTQCLEKEIDGVEEQKNKDKVFL